MVRDTWSPTDVALSPIYTPPEENPKYLIKNPRKVPQPPSSSTLDQGGSEAVSRHSAGEEIITEGLFITMPASGVMRE